MPRRRLAYRLLWATAGTVTLAVSLPSTARLLRPVVAGVNCTQFSPPDVTGGPTTDPHYDPEQGETVETVDAADSRTADSLLRDYELVHTNLVRHATNSLHRAEELTPAASVVTTISFNGYRKLDEVFALAARFGIEPLEIAHGYLGVSRYLHGGISAVADNGVPKGPLDIAEEYEAMARLLVGKAEELVHSNPGTQAALAVLTDAQARLTAAQSEGIAAIGLIGRGTTPQVSALARAGLGFHVGVVPNDCQPQEVIVPASALPMMAQQAVDVPEQNGAPVIGNSPRPEGR